MYEIRKHKTEIREYYLAKRRSMTEEETAAYYVTIDPTQVTNGEFQLNTTGAAEVAKLVKQAILGVPSKKLHQVLKK